MEKIFFKNALMFVILALFWGNFSFSIAGKTIASESKNYKISDDSIDFGRTYGGEDKLTANDKFGVKKKSNSSIGLASLGTISLRPMSFQIIFAVFIFLLIIFIIFWNFFKGIIEKIRKIRNK